jgi:deazaflavin-dependent oxidoreductase (nitroreductase family)
MRHLQVGATAGTATALHALTHGRPPSHKRRGLQSLVPRYSGSDRYRPPPRWYARLQWLGFVLTALGLSPGYVVTLEVPGRRSGVIRRTNLVLAEHDGQRYLVALAGESEWVRNVRAAAGRVVLARGQRRAATLVEVPVPDRAPVIRAYMLREGRRPGSAQVAREARIYFGVGANPTLAELGSVADRYPVFRVIPAGSEAPTVRHRRKAKDMRSLSYSTETVIRRAPEDVFNYCSDLRSELEWNPNVRYVEKLTNGPIGIGTRYRAQWSNTGPTTVEVVQFDRPRSWETYAKARGMGVRFRGAVTDAAPGARYTAYLELQPKRLARMVAPLALLAMRRQDQKNMHHIKEALESSAATSDSGRPHRASTS